MENKVLRKLTLQNLKAHRKTTTAFVLASSIFMSLVYVVFSLYKNDYVQTRHEILPMTMAFTGFLLVIFSFIFIIYASNFMLKQRYREFGLYSILGLEKKHIRRVVGLELIIEYIIIALISIPGGYLFGSLSFMMVNKLLEDTSTGFMDYPFDPRAAGLLLIVLGIIMLVILIMSSLKVTISNPLNLLKSSSKGEKEPKANLIKALLGVLFVAYGYYLAFNSQGMLESLTKIFKAVLFVVVGTYFLFNSLSIFILKAIKKNKNLYYKPENFLSISGMLYRMKANAASLASISILSTGIMVVLGMTFTSYLSMEETADSALVSDYSIEYGKEGDNLDEIVAKLNDLVDVTKVDPYEYMLINMNIKDGVINELRPFDSNTDLRLRDLSIGQVMTIKDFNKCFGESLVLEDNQIGFASNSDRLSEYRELNFMGKDYEVLEISKDKLDSRIAVDYALIVIPNDINYKQVAHAYPSYYKGEPVEEDLVKAANVYAEGDHQKIISKVRNIGEETGSLISSKAELREFIYQMNGGALFLGIVVSLVLLVGTLLMIYFKQISEGYDDRENYNIMKKVGLDDGLIRKTIGSQIIWIFILPILVAAAHTLASSKIIFTILGMIGVRDYSIFLINYLLVIGAFIISYGLMYLVTSKIYYRIVNNEA